MCGGGWSKDGQADDGLGFVRAWVREKNGGRQPVIVGNCSGRSAFDPPIPWVIFDPLIVFGFKVGLRSLTISIRTHSPSRCTLPPSHRVRVQGHVGLLHHPSRLLQRHLHPHRHGVLAPYHQQPGRVRRHHRLPLYHRPRLLLRVRVREGKLPPLWLPSTMSTLN